MIFGYDVIHGYRTIFPIPLAEAASWDPAAIGAVGARGGDRGSRRGPALDVRADGRHRARRPLGPHHGGLRARTRILGAAMAAARVRGFQGRDLSAADTIAACAKHYAAYGFAESGRDYNTVDISEQTLRNVVLPPFKAAADAGAATFMNSFNEIAGIPATANVHLQRDMLKGEWGFQGFVVSDWGSIGEMVPHGFSTDLAQAAAAGDRPPAATWTWRRVRTSGTSPSSCRRGAWT